MISVGIKLDDYLVIALVDLYVKCGSINKVYELFYGLVKKDLVVYIVMILGCGINGKFYDVIKLFEEMLDEDIFLNLVIFIGILIVYNYVGLVEEGYRCFNLMVKFGLMFSVDYCGIMVDFFGRVGRLDEVYDLIKEMLS